MNNFEESGYKFEYEMLAEMDNESPWEHCDGHGPVSEWTRRDKQPGERVLVKDGSLYRYYDYQTATRHALKENWGIQNPPPNATKRQIAALAADADFKRLKAWCKGDWYYQCLKVTLLTIDGEATAEVEYLGMIESDTEPATLEMFARECSTDIIGRLKGKTKLIKEWRLKAEDVENKAS